MVRSVFRFRRLAVASLIGLMGVLPHGAQSQPSPESDPHHHHHQTHSQSSQSSPHGHSVGPAGSTYDLRWIDAMVQHHTGALRMSELVFDIGAPGVGALAKDIWRDQAQEIKAMGQWRRAWYPDAPVFPVVLKAGGDPNAMAALSRMDPAQIEAMQMRGTPPSRTGRVTWFLEGMLQHHGAALLMAQDALKRSTNPTIRRLARNIIVAQRKEIIQIRQMLQQGGLNRPEYYRYDAYFALN